ncbi:hypothetical protein [Olleya sp. Bg11-27]|uniref:hypothetical protein n=1 Tax=Olleya sp. Bg11-27 TaxID=2058135 RepID=UPI000C30B2CD|nr:hypothetical protein [Olleya sp. Bg11-27]AUC76028.1 hypothetical protein CW732_10295 [Olleya sp. Bg11-27]
MLSGLANKNLISAINSTKSLIQVFIVILFLENYLIISTQKSLFNTSISFEKIHIAPFLFYFLSVAVAKFLWFVIFSIKLFIPFKIFSFKKEEEESNNKIPISTSFRLFLLFILSSIYLVLLSGKECLPFDNEKYAIFNNMYFIFCFGTALTSLFLCFTYKPDVIVSEFLTKENIEKQKT